MTLAEEFRRVFATTNKKKKQLFKEILTYDISQEEDPFNRKLLEAIFQEMELGRTGISIGRAINIPEFFREEGFKVEVNGSGFEMTF